ncbi:MAG: class I SAM-dependent methyltransferase, partial [Candidatus Heimdallarchaeota archaeon]|nr:class I SAM-dependent methyltransferase [Candidatus Heimdallarchaeota archaeon]
MAVDKVALAQDTDLLDYLLQYGQSAQSRLSTSPLPWNFNSTVMSYIRNSDSVLEIGYKQNMVIKGLTKLPHRVCVAEHDELKLKQAIHDLYSKEIEINQYDDDENLPFEDNSFDLIINNQETFSPGEMARILKP